MSETLKTGLGNEAHMYWLAHKDIGPFFIYTQKPPLMEHAYISSRTRVLMSSSSSIYHSNRK